MNSNIELYNEYAKNDNGTFMDKEIAQSFIQSVMSENANQKNIARKYVIQLKNNNNNKNKSENLHKTKTKAKNKKDVENVSENIVEKKMDQMNKTFETMMVQFQHMVQLNQVIQMNQMNQMQIMNQLLELKSNVIETRQDLSYKLKEINGQIEHIKDVQESQNNKIIEISNKRNGGGGGGRKAKEITNDTKEENVDYSHLYPLYKENIFTLLQTRNVDMKLVKNILKSKNMSGFIKIFDMLYKSKNLQNIDIYPIRVLKSKTLQYYNEEGIWLIDTNGTNIMNIVSSNIALVLSKINNDFFENGDFDSTLFMDNHNFIQELDDKKIRNQLFSSIKDLIINHSLNYKEVTSKEIVSKENIKITTEVEESCQDKTNSHKKEIVIEVDNIKDIQRTQEEENSDDEE